MRKATRFLGILAVICLVSGFSFGLEVIHGSGKMSDESKTVDAFDSIAVGGNYVLHVVAGKPSVVVHGDENIQPYLVAAVSNHTLYLDTKTGYSLSPTAPIVVTVSVAHLNALNVSGDAVATVSGLSSLEEATLSGVGTLTLTQVPDVHLLQVSGAGTLTASDIMARSLEVSMSGAGHAQLSGQVRALTLQLSGAIQLLARSLQAVDATIEMNGAGVATVNASRQLNITMSGDGQLTYVGRPRISQRVFGTGQLIAE